MYSRQIEIFVAVVESGSFNKAADKLFLSTTAVMKQINLLEDQLGVSVVERSNQGISLTPAGQSYYEDAERIISLSRNAVQKARQIAADSPYIIRIGSSFLNPVKSFIPIWNKVSELFPQFKLQIIPFDDNKNTIMDTIKSLGTQFDCIIGAFGSNQWLEHCNLYPLSEYKLSCAVSSDHPLATKEIINLEDLHEEHLMMVRAGDSNPNDEFRAYIEENHPTIQIIDTAYFYDIEVFNRCAQTGSVLLTLDSWANIHPSLITIPLKWNGTSVPFGLLYSKEANESVKKFVNAIAQVTQ
ncbi:LysR family transcriptional regulator [Paenibacillus sp. J45TS6]|uniref:LysR family transcriptional regulator n=1 Tax=unclassified Paenibacillus TaxID=185978 RepID=UPI001B219FA8|nr:LysR family transcriptional regulator [Paenibacillus sp. J45TS6]GIP44751.1 LysR family transcriptional regulator [Paenibacillus sp. J45TS6]